MTKDEALKLALVIEEFDKNDESLPLELLKEISATLRALAQPEQEPVAFLVDGDLYYPEEIDWETLQEQVHTVASLYTSPPKRPWVDVPDEEIKILWIQYRAALPRYLCFAKALLARAKEKNT